MIICPTYARGACSLSFFAHSLHAPPSFTFSAAGTIDFVEFAKWQLSNEERDQGAHGTLADIMAKLVNRADGDTEPQALVQMMKTMGQEALDLLDARGGDRSIRRKPLVRGSAITDRNVTAQMLSNKQVKERVRRMRRHPSQVESPVVRSPAAMVSPEAAIATVRRGGEVGEEKHKEGKGPGELPETKDNTETKDTTETKNDSETKNAMAATESTDATDATVVMDALAQKQLKERIRQIRRHPSANAPTWSGTAAVMGENAQGIVLSHERPRPGGRARRTSLTIALDAVGANKQQTRTTMSGVWTRQGDGVEVMLGVLWRNFKPEYFYFDIVNFAFKLVLCKLHYMLMCGGGVHKSCLPQALPSFYWLT